MKLNLNISEKIVQSCFEAAKEIGISAVIAVVGDDGKLIILKKMDNALPISIELAPAKAYTAYSMQMSTQKLNSLAQPGQMLYGIDKSCDDIVIFGGGIPIESDGQIIGALGVSGGSVDQDLHIAKRGLDFYKNRYTSG